MTDIGKRIEMLYEKDSREAYQNLLWLEALSGRSDALADYTDRFISMLGRGEYCIRVRGFRLLCKQAQWDADGKIDENIDTILRALDDEKPTAVRMALQFLGHSLLPHKKELGGKIKRAALAVNCAKFKDTVRPLLEKDIVRLVAQIGGG